MSQNNADAVNVVALKTGSFGVDSPIAKEVESRLADMGAFCAELYPQIAGFIGELQSREYLTSEDEVVLGMREAMVTYDLFDRPHAKPNGKNTIRVNIDALRVPVLFDAEGNPCSGELDEMGMYRLSDDIGSRVKKDGEEVGENRLVRHAYFNTANGMYSTDLANRYGLAVFQIHELLEGISKINCFANGWNPISSKRSPEAGVNLKLADVLETLLAGGELTEAQMEVVVAHRAKVAKQKAGK